MDRGDKIAVLVLVVLAWVAGAVLGLAFTGPQKIGTTTIEIGPDCRLVVVERRVREAEVVMDSANLPATKEKGTTECQQNRN